MPTAYPKPDVGDRQLLARHASSVPAVGWTSVVGLVELAMSRAMDSSVGPGAPASLSGANGYVDCP